MSQNVELAKIKLRMKHLMERRVDRGFTEHESLEAAEKLGQLIEQYGINLSELDLAEEACFHKFFAVEGNNRTAIDSIVVGISLLTNTKCWFTRGHDENWKPVVRYNYFGLESDVDMAVWLTETLKRTLDAETETFKSTDVYKNFQGHRRAATTSFQKGFESRVYRRLKELADQNEVTLENIATARTAHTGIECKSLVVVKISKIEEEFSKKFGFKLGRGSGRGHSRVNSSAYNAGQNAGNRANLNRPLGGSSQKLIG